VKETNLNCMNCRRARDALTGQPYYGKDLECLRNAAVARGYPDSLLWIRKSDLSEFKPTVAVKAEEVPRGVLLSDGSVVYNAAQTTSPRTVEVHDPLVWMSKNGGKRLRRAPLNDEEEPSAGAEEDEEAVSTPTRLGQWAQHEFGKKLCSRCGGPRRKKKYEDPFVEMLCDQCRCNSAPTEQRFVCPCCPVKLPQQTLSDRTIIRRHVISHLEDPRLSDEWFHTQSELRRCPTCREVWTCIAQSQGNVGKQFGLCVKCRKI